MNRNRMNLRVFENDANLIDRSGAESLIPEERGERDHPGRCDTVCCFKLGTQTSEYVQPHL